MSVPAEEQLALNKMIRNTKGALMHTIDVIDVWDLCLRLYGKSTRGEDLFDELKSLQAVKRQDLGYVLLLAFQRRNIKNGAGERDLFYQIFMALFPLIPETCLDVLPCLYNGHGYWMDLCNLYARSFNSEAVRKVDYGRLRERIVVLFTTAFVADYQAVTSTLSVVGVGTDDLKDKSRKVSLCTKWLPTPKPRKDAKTRALRCVSLRKAIEKQLPPKLVLGLGGSAGSRNATYRKMRSAVGHRLQTLEHMFCGMDNMEIPLEDVRTRFADCSWIPSVALVRSKKALVGENKDEQSEARQVVAKSFKRHLEAAQEGKARFNVEAAQPTDYAKFFATQSYSSIDPDPLMETALSQYLETLQRDQAGLGASIAMVDLSRSMTDFDPVPNLTGYDLAVFLGYVISQLSHGDLKNQLLSFATEPEMLELKEGSHQAKMEQIRSCEVGYSTNIEAAFNLLLSRLKAKTLTTVPQYLFVFSDMQFDEADENWKPVHDAMVEKWACAELQLPTLVYWNLYASHEGFVVNKDCPNAMMMSGFSPSMLKLFLSGKLASYNPMDVMKQDLFSDAYADVRASIKATQERLWAKKEVECLCKF